MTCGGMTVTFTPTANLDYSTTYTCTITTGAKDLAGNALEVDYMWSFTAQSETGGGDGDSVDGGDGDGGGGGGGVCFVSTAANSLGW